MLSNRILHPYWLVFVQVLIKSLAMIIDSTDLSIMLSQVLVDPVHFSLKVDSLSLNRIYSSQLNTLIPDLKLSSF